MSFKAVPIIIILIILAGIDFYLSQNHANTSPTLTPALPIVGPTPPTVAPTQPSVSPAPTSKYSPELKAQIRATFITNCKKKVGQQYEAQCNCGADYLATHYSESELAKIYLEYRSSSKVPATIQAAYDACNK